MSTFALITEGITDQVVLELLLESHYRDATGEDIEIRILQPLRDATDVSRQEENAHGGWENVLEHCSISERILEALNYNDYIVIQIDTDSCEHPNFNVPYRENGEERSIAGLIDAVRAEIVRRLGEPIFKEHQNKFLFAIAVHSTECWLVPLHAKKPAHARKTVSCAEALQRIVEKNGKKYSKDYDSYSWIAAPYRKAHARDAAIGSNESLAIFMKNLPVLSAADFT